MVIATYENKNKDHVELPVVLEGGGNITDAISK